MGNNLSLLGTGQGNQTKPILGKKRRNTIVEKGPTSHIFFPPSTPLATNQILRK